MNYYINRGPLLCQVHERDLMGGGLIIRMLGAGEVVTVMKSYSSSQPGRCLSSVMLLTSTQTFCTAS